jgi:hypothetical protein
VASCITSITHAQFLTPSAYLSFQDSPFRTVGFQQFWLENFEDGFLNTPGVRSLTGRVQLPSSTTDSVDGDDGSIDGFGTRGRSWTSGGFNSLIRFEFSRVNGLLPTHAGAVWTDVSWTTFLDYGYGRVLLQAFDASGVLIGGSPSYDLGDGRITGETAEDRFFGVTHLGGISAIELITVNSAEWELDHLQYGTIPSPGIGLAPLVALFAVRRRR